MSKSNTLYTSSYFERVNRWSHTEPYRAELKLLTELLCLKHGELAIDVGCGTGSAIQYITSQTGCFVVGVDHSANIRKYCKGLDVVVADAHRLPLRSDATFKAYLMHVIGHVTCPDAVLGEIRRILKSPGCLAVFTPNRNHISLMKPLNMLKLVRYRPDPTVLRFYDRRSLSETLRTAGLLVDRVLHFGPSPILLLPLSFFRIRMLERFRLRIAARAVKA